MPMREQYTARSARPPERRAIAKPSGRRTPTVVVLDRDENLRDAVSLQLRNLGYASLEAADAAAAIQFCLKGPVDLLLTDAAVPGMACMEMIEAARALKPDLPVIIMSNRIDAARASRPDCLRKPFRLEQLREKLEGVLGERAAGRRASV